ncbi:hypothetical protein JYB64_10395 [Algoriphagus aestuarii]|nr:hypothetical protein [Algoriphagus aestuarii]
MKEILIKSFVYPFYKAYLGFFILVTVVLGVFMEIKQHLMLAEKILQNDKWFLALLFTFLTYQVFQTFYIKRLIHDPRYRSFQKLSFLGFGDFIRFFTPVWLANQGLILLYTLLLCYVGIPLQAWWQVSTLLLFLTISFGISLYFNFLNFREFHPEIRLSKNRIFTNKPYLLWFIFHLKENRPLLLLLIKALSLFLLSGFFYSYYSGGYDYRWLAFGLLVASFAQYPIWLERWEFGEGKLYYFRNLPMNFGYKFGREFLVFLILMLPELTLILYQGSGMDHKRELGYLLVFWIGLNPGIFALCNWVQIHQKFSAVYLSFFLGFLAIIFGFNLAILSVLMISAAGFTFHSPYKI